MAIVRAGSYVLALAGLFLVTPADAQQSGPAERGEVTLQIAARGSVHSPPDLITLNAQVTTPGDTAAAASEAHKAKLDRLTRTLIAKGIDPKAISTEPENMPFGFVGYEFNVTDVAPPPVVTPAPSGAPSAPFPSRPGRPFRISKSSALQLKLTSQAQLAAARETLTSEGASVVGRPRLTLRDDRTARRSAIVAAIANARADAEVYASGLGMRIVRIVKVTNQPPTNVMDIYSAIPEMIDAQTNAANDVVTSAQATIDFILAPR